MKRTGHQTPGKKKKGRDELTKRPLNTNDLQGMKLRLENGDSHAVIAKAYGRAQSIVGRLHKAINSGRFPELFAKAQQREQVGPPNGDASSSTWGTMLPEQKSKAVAKLKAKGWSPTQIAKKYGINTSSLSYHYYGDVRRAQKPQKPTAVSQAVTQHVKQATLLREQGLKIKEVADKMGMSSSRVNYYIYGRKHHQERKENLNGATNNGSTANGAAASAQENILIGFAYAETERFIGLLGERLRLSPEILRPRLSKLLGHSPLRA